MIVMKGFAAFSWATPPPSHPTPDPNTVQTLSNECMMLTAGCASLPVLRSVGVDRDTVASGRAPTAPGLGREGIADTAKDGKETAAAKWMQWPFHTLVK